MSKNYYSIKASFDYEIKFDYDKLIKYLNDSKYYELLTNKKKNRNRVEGIRILGEISNTSIYLKYTPDRKVVNLNKNKNNIDSKLNKKCPLCLLYQSNNKISPINLVRSLLWKDYIISPNTYPYFKNHMLILASNHNHGKDGISGSQIILHKNNKILSDMMSLYFLLGKKGTMFFNGLIGNSQLHFHFHMTSEDLPIKEILYKNNELNFDSFKTKKNNSVLIFKKNNIDCLNGIIFYGNYKTLSKEIFNLLKSIDTKKILYNLLFIQNKENDYYNENITCIIYLRKKLKSDKIEDYNMGATSFGGFLLIDKNDKSKLKSSKFIKDIKQYCDLTVVKPSKELIKNILK